MDEKEIAQKLNAPKKLSAFERQRQEAEAKKRREDAEAEAVARQYKEHFGGSDDEDEAPSVPTGPRGGVTAGYGAPRHFPGRGMMKSGPGSLDPPSFPKSGPGSLGPPPMTLKRKREMEEERDREMKARDSRAARGSNAFDDFDERRKSPQPELKRPTMMLEQLPKRLTRDEIKALFPASLKVEDVTFVPPSGPAADRRFSTAIVAVAPDTPRSDVVAACSALSGKYLGFGCYLKINVHVSTSVSALGSGGLSTSTHNLAGGSADFQPFGARPLLKDTYNMRNSSMNSRDKPLNPLVIKVSPPSDLKLLKAVHKTAEKVIRWGPAFETALLSNPDVQQDETWAWIFDNTSQASNYYRWLLYEHYAAKTKSGNELTVEEREQFYPDKRAAEQHGLIRMFDRGPLWLPPLQRPAFEFTTEFEDLIEDSGYNSSADDFSDEELPSQKNTNTGTKGTIPLDSNGGDSSTAQPAYLNPYRRAKLVHLLARQPDTIANLSMGSVARVTNFVVANALCGAEEIVEMLVENIEHPYSRCVTYSATPDDHDSDMDDNYDPDDQDAAYEAEMRYRRRVAKSEELKSRTNDLSSNKLIALYLVSDAARVTTMSGVSHAWKYRNLFEHALKSRKIFEHLGRLDKVYGWGRVKMNTWQNKIKFLLDLWEGWTLFSIETLEFFRESFFNPPLTPEEQVEKNKAEKEEAERKEKEKWKSAGTGSGTVTPGTPSTDSDRQSAEQKQADLALRLEALKRKAAIAKAAAALPPSTLPPPKTAAPAATSININPEQEQQPQQPAPKISVGNLKMSLGGPSGSSGSAPPGITKSAPSALSGGGGFSLGLGKKPSTKTDVNTAEEKKKKVARDMFEDSDDD